MAHGRLLVASDNTLSDQDIAKIIKLFTYDIADSEDKMINAWQNKHKPRLSFEGYSDSLNILVSRLRCIADNLFHETNISKVKPYSEKDKIPDNYRNYLCVAKNLAKCVTQDILFQPDLWHALAAFERWLYVCRTAFHQHDLFTSSCVINGLNSESISVSKIESELDETTETVLIYYRSLLVKASQLYHRQNALFKENLDIIPSLHALSDIYEKLHAKSECSDNKDVLEKYEAKIKKRSVSQSFSSIKKKNSAQLPFEDNLILNSLYQEPGNMIDENHKVHAQSLRGEVFHQQFLRNKSKKTLPKFTIIPYVKGADLRVDLILLQNNIQYLEKEYPRPIEDLLYRVRTAINDVTCTDRIVFAKINEEFLFHDLVLDKKLTHLHEQLGAILVSLIKNELKFGKTIKNDDLKDSIQKVRLVKDSISDHIKEKNTLPESISLSSDPKGSSSLSTEEKSPMRLDLKKVNLTADSISAFTPQIVIKDLVLFSSRSNRVANNEAEKLGNKVTPK